MDQLARTPLALQQLWRAVEYSRFNQVPPPCGVALVSTTLGGSLRPYQRSEYKGTLRQQCSGYRLSTSVGGAATGEGGDRIVCDDPHNVQEAESDSVRKGTIDWWDVVMSTRVNDPKTSAKVVSCRDVISWT